MRIVFLGTPEFAVPALRTLYNAGHEIVLVVSQPDRPAGRGNALRESPVKRVAASYDLPVAQPETLARVAFEHLRACNPDVVVVVAYGAILGRDVRALGRFGAVNLHPSLLPRHRGPAPVASALLAGDSYTGATVMQVTARLDSGPILGQMPEPISAGDTAESLLSRLAVRGAVLLRETIAALALGQVHPETQEERLATYSRKLTRSDAALDISAPAIEIWRRWRALQPWPGLTAVWGDRQIELFDVAARSDRGGLRVGQIGLAVGKIRIGCGSGAIEVGRIREAGRRLVTAEEYVRGAPAIVGASIAAASVPTPRVGTIAD